MNLDRFMLFENKVQLNPSQKDNERRQWRHVHDVVDLMAMMTAELMFRGQGDSGPGVTSVTSGKSTWHADRS